MKLKLILLPLFVPFVAHAAYPVITYQNARFGFFVDIPAPGFQPQGESDNGDGQAFLSIDGKSEIVASGGWLMEPDAPCSAGSYLESAAQVTYTHSKGEVSVVSGIIGDDVFYRKTIRVGSSEPGRCLNLSITYPASQKNEMDEIVKNVSKGFRASQDFHG